MKNIDPDKSIGFLIYEVSRLMRLDFNDRVEPLGLTQVQWRAIVNIARNEGCHQAVLADLLEIKPITLTRLIDRLMEAGWVIRKPDRNDRRAMKLYLTDKARPLLGTMHEKAIETRAKAIHGITDDEYAVLFETLRKMKANLTRK